MCRELEIAGEGAHLARHRCLNREAIAGARVGAHPQRPAGDEKGGKHSQQDCAVFHQFSRTWKKSRSGRVALALSVFRVARLLLLHRVGGGVRSVGSDILEPVGCEESHSVLLSRASRRGRDFFSSLAGRGQAICPLPFRRGHTLPYDA